MDSLGSGTLVPTRQGPSDGLDLSTGHDTVILLSGAGACRRKRFDCSPSHSGLGAARRDRLSKTTMPSSSMHGCVAPPAYTTTNDRMCCAAAPADYRSHCRRCTYSRPRAHGALGRVPRVLKCICPADQMSLTGMPSGRACRGGCLSRSGSEQKSVASARPSLSYRPVSSTSRAREAYECAQEHYTHGACASIRFSIPTFRCWIGARPLLIRGACLLISLE